MLNGVIQKNIAGVHLTCDKANSANNGSKSATFPKMVHVSDHENFVPVYEDRIEIVEALLDCNAAGSTSDEYAAAVAHSVRQKLAACSPILFAGICTNSGGGGARESMKQSLINEGFADQDTSVGTCNLHNTQTGLKNAIK